MKSISGISSIIETYDALLLDLWGVIHDGSHLYPGVKETLVELRKAGKKIVFLSNAPRRAAKAEAVLNQLGVKAEWYDHIVTSGEIGNQWLADGKAPFGKRYYYVGPGKDADVLDGLDYRRVDDLKDANFLLNVGFGSEEQSGDDWQMLLRAGAKLGLPMICLNPDLEVVKITGERFPCAGVLAADYERMKGEVMYFGKPYPAVYEYCMAWLAPLAKANVLAVGDGVMTDIAGAKRYGIDAALVTGGILKAKGETVEAVCAQYNVTPDYVMSAFVW